MTRATQDRNATVQALKLLFLLCICYGHIFAEGPGASLMHTLPMRLWWVPGDVGLFFFTATSGYFTTLRYPSPDRMEGYWTRKVSRLFGLFLFLNAVLGCVFLVTGRNGLFSMDTLFNLAGLNGFLNWFHLGNESPFGAGQWFMTLLLLFYLVYPWLGRVVTTPARGRLLLWGGIALAAVMQVAAPYGHSLWSTSVGFLAGFWLARFGGGNAGRVALFAAISCVAGAVGYSLSGHQPVVAYAIIGVAGVAVTGLALTGIHPLLPSRLVAAFGDLLLPLYIIHTYFRLPLADNPYLDALLVLGMNVCIAWVLQRAYGGLVRLTALMAGRPDTVRGRAA
uniref:Acyltransferase 3 domain-containing protein n=1 Tax=Nitratidesulfovibrio vulgaris (strain DSM 19637 / Miyazaki F) TaxID=883 RepID=B8DK28_NITV9